MSSGPTHGSSRSWFQLSETGFRVLLIVGSIAVVSLALALHFANDASTPATSIQTEATQPISAGVLNSTPSPEPTYTGSIAFRCDIDTPTGICLLDVTTNNVSPLEDSSVYETAKAREPFSPDGSRTVFSQRVGQDQDILIRHVFAGWVDQIISTPASEYQAVWSPTGSWLAYAVQDDTDTAIWMYDLSTGASRQLTYPNDWNDKHPTWSPSGDRIVFSSDRNGIARLYVIDVESEQTQMLGPAGLTAWDPVWIKPPIQQESEKSAQNELGIGVTFDESQCTGDITVGGYGTAPSITHVVVRTSANILHDSGDIETSLYRAGIGLDPQSGTTTLEVHVWHTGAPDTPLTRERTVTCEEPNLPTIAETESPAAGSSPTPTLIVVTPQPEAADVFAAATMAAEATEQASTIGTATPTPPNVATATFTPVPLIVTATPQPANEATQTAMDTLATAIAFTTGTPTPWSRPYVIATNTPVSTPTPAPTETPVLISLEDLQRTPAPVISVTPEPGFPPVLLDKIVFLSDMSGDVEAYAMNPDGTGIARLTDRWPYDYADQRDAYSADRRYHAYSDEEEAGFQRLQIFYRDTLYNVTKQATFIGVGRAWLPAWSPTDEAIAFVSNQSGNDEIWLAQKDQWPAEQLTDNTWEWDHHPSWSPDGTQLVFSSNRSGQRQLWIMNADGSQQRRISPDTFEAWDPVWVKYVE